MAFHFRSRPRSATAVMGWLGAYLAFATAMSAAPRQLAAQEGPVPREGYFLSMVPYYAGEYRSAGTAFRNAAGSGVRSVSGRWIDSICYHTMVGECFYQLGDYPRALEQYDSALRLYLAHSERRLAPPH